MKAMRIIAALSLLAVALPAGAQDKQTAVANFVGKDGKEDGRAQLTAAATGGVLIEVEISGLPVNKWVAFHVHETGRCDAATHHESAGGHFNPEKAEHGILAARAARRRYAQSICRAGRHIAGTGLRQHGHARRQDRRHSRPCIDGARQFG